MEIILSFFVGILFTTGVYLILHRSFFKLILGLIMFSNATNLFVFISGGLTREKSAIISETASQAQEPFSDPLPQALVLTAIVIGFGIQAYAIVLIKRLHQAVQTNDMDQLNATDKIDSPA